MAALVFSFYDAEGHLRRVRLEHHDVHIGSDPSCEVVLPGLAARHCRVYRSRQGYYAHDLAGGLTVDGRQGSGYLQDGSVLRLPEAATLRFNVESPAESPAEAPDPIAREASPAGRPSSTEAGARHRPILALLLSLVVPGAGQAYNGQPIKGVFLFLTSVLVLPWLFALYDAHAVASRMAASGGRTGPGGLAWVPPHLWFVSNVALTILVVLTIAGVLQ